MKRGKPWSRGDKIAFGSLLATVLSVFIALLFPEFRIWLHLEKKPAPPVVARKFEPLPAMQSAEPTPTPAPKPRVNQHSNAVVKGNRNVAGNNVVGNGNMVGNNNPVAVAPNGIANAAPNFGNQTVNNMGPPDPKISLENVKNPHVCVKITIDRMMENPKFGVVCDRPCKSVFGDVILPESGGGKQTSYGVAPERPDVGIFVVNFPNPMPSNYGYLGCVESGDGNPVRILGVVKVITKP